MKHVEQSTHAALQEALRELSVQRCDLHESRTCLKTKEESLADVQKSLSQQHAKQEQIEAQLQRVRVDANRLALRDCEYIKQVHSDMMQCEMHVMRQEMNDSQTVYIRPESEPQPNQVPWTPLSYDQRDVRAPFTPRPQSATSRRQAARNLSTREWHLGGSGSNVARVRHRDPYLVATSGRGRLGESIRSSRQDLEVYTLSKDGPAIVTISENKAAAYSPENSVAETTTPAS